MDKKEQGLKTRYKLINSSYLKVNFIKEVYKRRSE